MGAGASAVASGPQDKSFVDTMVEFSAEARKAAETSTAPDLLKKWTEKRDELILKVRGDLEKDDRTQANTMITLLQEQIYTAKGLPDNLATEVQYDKTEDGYVASCGDHKIQLGGNFPAGQMRLVVTPLTRICRQKIFEGAATGKIVFFHGPAGTGKTETMKDTLHDLGYDVTVVNCSGSMTPEQLKEVIAEGKPVVFDEFNRLKEDVIKEFISLIPKEKPTIGITCNPAAEGLAELPDELKSQCVSQEMLVPDYALIAEIMLFTEGFKEGADLGVKAVNFLKAAAEKCSKQPHYDFGMRMLKTLTKHCGANGRADEFKDENLIVASTISSILLDSAVLADREVLKELIKESFGIEVQAPADEGDRWAKATAALGRVTKIRHGAMVVNVSKDDEEACIAAVTDAAKAAESSVVRVEGNMNVGLDAFVGKQNGDDWSEGAFTKALREAIDKKAWLVVVCGEEATATNFEQLNTLLDDNKMLVLETGEKIPLAPENRVIFIAKECSNMSPASVSRLGMVWSE